MSGRASKKVRSVLAERLRALRKERGFSQKRLGDEAGLSGKFIGEVERGEKSISVDSLYRIAVALDVPLAYLTDLRPAAGKNPADRETERIFALIAGQRRREDLRKAYDVLKVMFGQAS